MKENHKLGLYVSYYLARFNEIAYENLGYGNMHETHERIGKILSVPTNTVKNWRDEFDPLFGHRVGWYQRPMNPSRVKVAEALEELGEISIRAIVRDILIGNVQKNKDEFDLLISITNKEIISFNNADNIQTTPTSKAAKDFFLSTFYANHTPFEGVLSDYRNLEVGFDFKIENMEREIFVIAKGLSGETGSVLFSNKEWQLANDKKDKYYLCVIKNIATEPTLQFICNPAKELNPRKKVYSVIQVNWSVSEKELSI